MSRVTIKTSVDGPFFNVVGPDELTVFFEVNLASLEATGALGFLQLDISTMTWGDLDLDARGVNKSGIFNEKARSLLHAGTSDETQVVNAFRGEFTVDIGDPSGEGRLTLGEIGAAASYIEPELTAISTMHLNLLASLGGDASFPSVAGEMHLFWGFDQVSEFADSTPEIEFRDIRMNMGEFFTDLFGDVLSTIQDVTGPLGDIVNVLTTPIPVLSDLLGPTAIVDLAEMFGMAEYADYIRALDTILDLAGDAEMICVKTEDHKEALAAFRAKREPVFKGR